MRRLSFIFTILGVLILLFLLGFGKQTEINNPEELERLELNSRVFISGKTVSEKIIFGADKILVLDSGIELVCSCSGNFKDKKVEAEGIVSEYNGVKQIRVLKIFTEND